MENMCMCPFFKKLFLKCYLVNIYQIIIICDKWQYRVCVCWCYLIYQISFNSCFHFLSFFPMIEWKTVVFQICNFNGKRAEVVNETRLAIVNAF